MRFLISPSVSLESQGSWEPKKIKLEPNTLRKGRSNYRGWIMDSKVLENGTVMFKYLEYHESGPSTSRIFIKTLSQSLDYNQLEYKGLEIPFPKMAVGNKLFSIIPSEQLENHIAQLSESLDKDDYWKNIVNDKQPVAILLEFELH